MLRLLHSDSMAGSQFLYPEIEANLYRGFFIRMTGTQAAANAGLSMGEIGKVVLSVGGRTIVRADFDLLHYLGELKGGDMTATQEAAVNQVFEYVCYVPRFWNDDNVELVKKQHKSQLAIEYGPNALAGIVPGSATVEVYGVPARGGEQAYRLNIHQIDYPISAASTKREPVPFENVIGLFFDRSGTGSNNALAKGALTAGANWTKLHVSRDGQEVTFNASVSALQAFSNMSNRIEATYSRFFEVDLANSNVAESLSDNIGVSFETTGAHTIRMLTVWADFTPDELEETRAATQGVAQQIASRKLQDGKTRPIKVLQAL